MASDAGNVFVGNIAGSFYALNARNGTVLWKWIMPDSNGGVTSATVYDMIVFVGSILGDRLWAIDELSGQLRWVSNHSGGSIFGPPIIYKDTVRAVLEARFR